MVNGHDEFRQLGNAHCLEKLGLGGLKQWRRLLRFQGLEMDPLVIHQDGFRFHRLSQRCQARLRLARS